MLEFGVIFHSVIIGLTLGTAGAEFSTLYPVIIFHQAFEGMGVGARLSAIPFPRKLRWAPWALCGAYGLTTPVAIAIALGIRTTYNGSSFTANWRSVNGATGYRFDVATDSSFTNYVPGYQDLDVGNVTSKNVTGLAARTIYYYRVRAYNGNGTSPNSNVVQVKTRNH